MGGVCPSGQTAVSPKRNQDDKCFGIGHKEEMDMEESQKKKRNYRAVFLRVSLILVDILAVKNSVDYFITHNSKYTRQNTLVSLRIALILYFIIQSFKCN